MVGVDGAVGDLLLQPPTNSCAPAARATETSSARAISFNTGRADRLVHVISFPRTLVRPPRPMVELDVLVGLDLVLI